MQIHVSHLDSLRGQNADLDIIISPQFEKDVDWFARYAGLCNSHIMMEPKLAVFLIECDACPQGGGRASNSKVYYFTFPQQIVDGHHISSLAAINALVAVKTLIPPNLQATRVVVHTDNIVVMYVLNTGKTKEPILTACSRQI